MREEDQNVEAPGAAPTISAERLDEIRSLLESGQNVELTPEEEQAILDELTGDTATYSDPLIESGGELPITYDGAPSDEISPEALKQMYRQLARKPRLRFRLPPAMQAKRAANRTKNRKKNKLAKVSRRANRQGR